MSAAGRAILHGFLILSLFSAVSMAEDIEGKLAKLKSRDATTRSMAAGEAIRQDRVRGVPAVLSALRAEKNREVRLHLINALGEAPADPATVAELTRHLSSGDPDFRLQAACALARGGSSTGLKELETVITDINESRGRRSFAVRSLRGIPTGAAVRLLQTAAGNKDAALRLQAVGSLASIGTPEALRIIRTMADNDPDERIRTVVKGLQKGRAPR